MIERVASKPEWFYVDDQTLAKVLGLPGSATRFRQRSIIHRSMLPLIDTSEAENARVVLARPLVEHPSDGEIYFKPDWAGRDRLAAGLGFQYRTTQHQAIDFISSRRGALLGDDMRLGKR